MFWRLEVVDSPYSVGFISTLRELLLIRDQRLGFVVVPASCWFPEGSDPDGGVLLILNLERFGYFLLASESREISVLRFNSIIIRC